MDRPPNTRCTKWHLYRDALASGSRLSGADTRVRFVHDAIRSGVVSLLEEYAAFNPHATFHYTDGGEPLTWKATEVTWQKWRPSDRTSPHWYPVDRFRSLIAAYLKDEQSTEKPKTLRAFVAEFCGLRRSDQQKLVIDAIGMSGASLRDLVDGDDISMPLVQALLTAMQREAKPVKPSSPRDHWRSVDPSQPTQLCPRPGECEISKGGGGNGWTPLCAWRWPVGGMPKHRGRRVMTGINWTPTLSSPFPALQSLWEARVDRDDDVVVWVHLALPRPDFTDRGKTRLPLPWEIDDALHVPCGS